MHLLLTIFKKNILLWLALLLCSFAIESRFFETSKGVVNFKSEAPLEIIQASSSDLVGLIDASKNTFSFSVNMNTFKGFNSPLQKVHFNENYLESEKYPQASFKGKIIEDADLLKNGVYHVRAKGIFTIHGVAQERIIKADITVNNNSVTVQSKFEVLLSDHNIPIPKVVNQKLANSIKIDINASLHPR